MKTAENFDLAQYLAEKRKLAKRKIGRRDWELHAEGRRQLTRDDPLLFALTYLPHHLRGESTGEKITFADPHLQWAKRAKRWMHPVEEAAADRIAEIAPRETGKSTWFFLILPLWAAAHGHIKFAAAVADSATQAETHLQTFKEELEKNAAIREDFPALVEPLRRNRNATVSDSKSMYQARSGFAFAARGIDSGILGLKVGRQRPDLLILDDIEPSEATYSLFQKAKRLSTISDVILPLNVHAHVVIVGTVTMPGSIMHELVKAARGIEVAEWIADEKIEPHYHAPILKRDDGSERSTWPAKWPMRYLNSIRHTRSYAKNYANDPLGADGDYWTSEDFIVGDLAGVTRTGLFIDPAVTTKKSSDYTGLAVVGYAPRSRQCLVSETIAVRLAPSSLRHRVLVMLGADPRIRAIFVEANQGGDTWKAILHDMPRPVVVFWSGDKKEVRAADVLNDYQQGRVIHLAGADGMSRCIAAEEQMVAFPNAPNDDLVDAVGSGVSYFLRPKKKRKAGATTGSYV